MSGHACEPGARCQDWPLCQPGPACPVPSPPPQGCTCGAGGAHDPRSETCDKAILDGTATLPVYVVNPRDHQVTRLRPSPYLGQCSCGDVVEGAGPAEAYTAHLAAVRERQADQ